MKVYIHDWNNIFTDVKKAIGEENLSSPQDADIVVLFADTRGPLKEMAERSKQMGKKVYVLQHGRAATRDYQKPLGAKLIADKFMAWGQADYERMKKLGYADKTVIVGCPLLKKVKPRVAHEEKNVLFVPVNADHEQPENLVVYYELLKMNLNNVQNFMRENHDGLKLTWDFKRKKGVNFHDIAGFTLIAKILPNHAERLYQGNVIKSHPGSPVHMDQLFEILSNVDCVVGLDECTTELMAVATGVPVIICEAFSWETLGGQDYKDVELVHTKSTYRTSVSGLSVVLNSVLFGKPDAAMEMYQEDVREYELGSKMGDPIDNILREIGFVRELQTA